MIRKMCPRLASGAIISFMLLVFASAASAEWKEKVLYSFQGVPDGAVPTGAVVFDKAGNLYGATGDGGASTCAGPGQCGTVYQLAPPATQGGAWTETVLYIFKGHAQNDGATPEGGLVIDQTGNLYGTTGYGGSGPCLLLGGAVGCGTVYELSPPAKRGDPWTETVLYSFQGGKDGYVATGDLVFDQAGNLYGATLFGGGKGTTCDSFYGGQCGTVFKLSPPKTKGAKWTEKVLHSFAGITGGKQNGDGASPNGGLVLDSKGDVYGTTFRGGYNCPHSENQGCGTAFVLNTPIRKGQAWTEDLVHVFKDGKDSALPAAGVMFGAAGQVYGTTLSTVFRLMPPSKKSLPWKLATLYTFAGSAVNAESPVIFDSKGNLYGTTLYSGGPYYGTVYRLNSPKRKGRPWTHTLLYGFNAPPDGGQPAAGLVFGATGSLYSTTTRGGNSSNCSFYGCGTVFETMP